MDSFKAVPWPLSSHNPLPSHWTKDALTEATPTS